MCVGIVLSELRDFQGDFKYPYVCRDRSRFPGCDTSTFKISLCV